MTLFGDATTSAQALVDGLLASNPHPSVNDIAAFLRLCSPEERDAATRILVQKGIAPTDVVAAQTSIGTATRGQWKNVATLVAAGAAGFHGYRRNNSLFWAVAWFGLGAIFPVITSVVALAQGFGEPRKA